MATVIEFQSVSKSFPDKTLGLADLTMQVAEGAQTCLLGPSGSGKTTVVRMLQAALLPTGGSVTVFGVSVDTPAYRKVRRRLGIMPQRPGMYPDLRAGEYLDLAAQLAGDRYERVAESMDLVGYLRTRMNELPTNVQRRVALAGALVGEPDVLVLDEPTEGLDPDAATDVKRYVGRVMSTRTSLLCTHNEAEGEEFCGQVIKLRRGRAIAHGTWEQVRGEGQPRMRVAARQGIDRLLSHLMMLGYDAEPAENGVLVRLADPQQDTPEMLRRLLEANIDVYECTQTRTPVESSVAEAVR
jgi:ABC-2 type transport system ATP-binding protein